MKTYIVIGASAAGIGALTKLRQLDKESKVICICDQEYFAYNKCLLADYLCGIISKERMFFKDLEFFKKNNIDLLLNKKVTKIDPAQNKIYLSDGTEIFFTKLFIGSGTSAFIPKSLNLEKIDGTFTFHTFQDVCKISDFIKLNNVKNIVVIGAGLSGVECAAVFAKMSKKVSLICRKDHILSSMLDLQAATLLENILKINEINILKDCEVLKVDLKIDQDKKLFELMLSNNQKLIVDMVIFTVGNKPNTDFLENSKILVKNGFICTNDFMQTNFENIYAAGDVCLIKDIVTDKYVKSCSWPDAMQQGMIAASNMLDQQQIYPGSLITVSSNIFDTPFVSCGCSTNFLENSEVIIKKDSNFYHKIITKDGKLIGFLMVGKIENVGELRSKIYVDFRT